MGKKQPRCDYSSSREQGERSKEPFRKHGGSQEINTILFGKANRSVDDAVNMALHFLLQHLDTPGTYARILFVDFSSAFNTIIPALLQDKLSQLHVPDSTYDTTLIGLISGGEESAYRWEMDHLVTWCGENHLELNALKAVEMVVDFRKNAAPPAPITLCGSPVTAVESFHFLGTIIAQDLKWEQNICSLIKKAQQRMFFLRQLKKFNLPKMMMVNFYTSIMESILTSSITIWLATAKDKGRLQRVIRSAEKHNIPLQEDLEKWPYLKDIKINEIASGIGTNSPKVLEPWELINSQGEGPYAVKTLLGWVFYGPLKGSNDSRDANGHPVATVNRISMVHLEELLVKQYNHDFNENTSKETEEMSREDKQFLNIMNHSAKTTDGHYCLDLPFRQENPSMPNNRCVAEQRIQGLKRKFGKNEKFHDEYTSFLTEMINNDYAEMVPVNQLKPSDNKRWYIPHHGVYHSKKGTLRVVFDCGAVFKGTSLNCQLLEGPHLTNSLIGVLIRFRQEPVALMADIKAMFHQVKVSKGHIDYLRFLWWPNGDVQRDLAEYRMKVHLFGAVSSPSCANFTLRKTAEDNKDNFTADVVDTVKNNFYVDDCLKSMPSESEAVKMVGDLIALCRKGGFMLSKWISNSRAVLASIPQQSRTKETKDLDLDRDKLPMERALGLHWCVETDVFKFKIAAQERPYTRRGILSVVGSIYDPLGFLAPFTLPAKLIMQELCRKKLGWDENIPQALVQQWSGWLADINKMAEFQVDRCMKPTSFGHVRHAQLHHFSDASESGYGTVSYLRLENDNKEVHVSFITGKSRVSPLKQVTIPRMELTAAVLAVKIDTMLKNELQLQLDQSVFWTDSTTVLKYIKNENKRFQTFVANRISLIRDAMDVSQWRYIGTKENPADEASRGLKADQFLNCRRWIKGPEFLSKPDREWPNSHVDSDIPGNDPEIKQDITMNVIVKDSLSPTNSLINHFSSWRKLKTAVAWLLKVKTTLLKLRHKEQQRPMTLKIREKKRRK
ncbi:uncharacterized protein LOC117547324 [Gymnodraco acuticeps]|uniref:Uncharacterized protein LOC117547324 n=1 Tax=Gymnodraco acuticeps TaxID=8218 RepID=A0A6P8UAH4_GYMAC|nr:uncharacterized protein LOC117547324 [Gymnodraco acuticeps]